MKTTHNTLYQLVNKVEHKNVLDELSDGQWHPEYKIKKQVKNKEVLTILQELNKEGVLIAGNNNSFRMNGENLRVWREITDFDKKDTPRYTPRFFGGILEDDGWLLAPLHNNNLIHFRMKYDVPQHVVKKLLGENVSLTRSEDGLYRVLCKENGKELYELIKNFENEEGQKVFSGVRLEENVKRRDIKDLPKRFSSDLCVYYGNFAKVLLRPNMTSITKHITDTDDIQQQIYIWVIDAVQRYDHTTSIPFAAYLGKMLGKWVFNLNRQSFGRNIADVELKHSRAANKFREENDREPTADELAKMLGESVETINSERNNINSVSNIRRVGTIDNDDSPVHLTTTEDITVKYEELINQTLLSAAVTASAAEENPVNIVGWLNVYHQTWGDVKNKKYLPNADSKTVSQKMENILSEAQKRLTSLEV